MARPGDLSARATPAWQGLLQGHVIQWPKCAGSMRTKIKRGLTNFRSCKGSHVTVGDERRHRVTFS